jgi:hypothetical protein
MRAARLMRTRSIAQSNWIGTSLATRLAWLGVLALLTAASVVAASDEPRAVIYGNWIATVGPRQFRGEWSAQVLADNPNAAVGSWMLIGDNGRIISQGTWSAEKAAKRWRGTWSARVQGGGPLSGTWEADPKSLTGKTFEDMLRQTGDKQIAGWWRSRTAQGSWWLSALTRVQPSTK